MKHKYSDFKITSIIISAILIFFTISYFRFIPLTVVNININNYSYNFQVFYLILTEFIALLLSIIFVLVYSKKSDKELITRYKSIGIGIGIIAFYFIFPYFQIIPFKLLNSNPAHLTTGLTSIYLIAYSSLMASIVALIYNKKISKDWKKFKKNSNKYFSENIKYWIISLIIMMFSNLLIQAFIKNGIAGNEQSIRDLLVKSPVYIFFSAVIYAPVMEELTFRLSIKKIFSNKWVFIILSGLFFGSLHVFSSYNDITDLLFIIPYSVPGMAFAYMLEKTDNIIVPMSFHFLHNGIMISLLTLISLI